jgi:hypothetical protein
MQQGARTLPQHSAQAAGIVSDVERLVEIWAAAVRRTTHFNVTVNSVESKALPKTP